MVNRIYNNKEMDATEENGHNDSFDSSIELDQLSLTETMNSEQPQVARAINLNFDDQFVFDSITQTPEKQKNCLQIDKNAFVANTFVGFKNAWGDKQIQINQSKLKRAKKFFDDTQLQDQSQCNTVGFGGFDFTTILPEPNQEYSMPCFKSVGTGAQVKISDQAKQKASLFRQFQSIKKPTKVKKTLQISNQSIIKTYNAESKFKMDGGIINVNRKSFNWEQYQKEFREEIQRDMKEGSKQGKRATEPKRKTTKNILNSSREYVFIKLFALNISSQAEKQCSLKLATQVRNIPYMKFSHKQDQCTIVQCVFCKIGLKQQYFQVKQIYNILNKQFSKKWVKYQQFYVLYMQVCFKLLKYQAYWPDIINKHCHVSNIVVEINKKLLLTEKESQTSYLRYCILNEQIGRRINLIIQDKYFNQKMSIVFVKVSDGWSSVWAAIEQKNLLFKYIREGDKAKIGTKLALSLWSIHPISNILHFCNQAEDKTAKCIQFFYNGSIILQPNAKLGHVNEEFYRPLDKCRVKGGLIPVVQGIIVRLFSIKNISKKGRNQNSFSLISHFAEILTVQGFVCLVKFSLNEESSLVEYFRLYHTYRLYKLKIISEENVLSYLMQQSRYEEVKGDKISQKDQIYPERICKLLRKRLLNVKNAIQWQDGIYDVLCKDKKVVMSCGKQYSLEIEAEIGNFSSLYQQVKVERITDNFIKIYKNKQSSQLRKFPKIYDKLIQTQ